MPRRADIHQFAAEHPDLMPVLIEQMKRFLTEDIIISHQDNKVINHKRRLLPDHRKFISMMEAFFIEKGHPSLVPLPKWDPGTHIPDGFFDVVRVSNDRLPLLWNPMDGLLPARETNSMDIDPDYNDRSDKPYLPDELRLPKLLEFEYRQDLEHFIGHNPGPNYHSECHAKLGGPMFNEYTTAGALIFWPLHAFVDDIYFDWQQGKSQVEIIHIEEDPLGEDWQGEYVELLNQRYDAIDMTGWTLTDKAGHQFTFPSYSLRPEGIVRVWTGPGSDTEDNLHWGRQAAVWNNNGDEAVLAAADGAEIDRYAYKRLLPW